MKITTSPDDDFLYEYLLDLLEQIKLVQGGTALSASLRRHAKIKIYMIEKQIQRIKHIEETYFSNDGINQVAVQNHLNKYPLQKNINNVN